VKTSYSHAQFCYFIQEKNGTVLFSFLLNLPIKIVFSLDKGPFNGWPHASLTPYLSDFIGIFSASFSAFRSITFIVQSLSHVLRNFSYGVKTVASRSARRRLFASSKSSVNRIALSKIYIKPNRCLI